MSKTTLSELTPNWNMAPPKNVDVKSKSLNISKNVLSKPDVHHKIRQPQRSSSITSKRDRRQSTYKTKSDYSSNFSRSQMADHEFEKARNLIDLKKEFQQKFKDIDLVSDQSDVKQKWVYDVENCLLA